MKGTRKNSFQKIFVNLLQRLVIKETQRSSDACVHRSVYFFPAEEDLFNTHNSIGPDSGKRNVLEVFSGV